MTDDDVDARFAEIVRHWQRPSDEPEPQTREQEPPEPELLWPEPEPARRFDPLDPTPDEPYVPEPLPKAHLSGWAWAGTGLLGYALVMVLGIIVGFRFPLVVGWSVVFAFIAGLIILFSRLPRRRDPWDGDGAQV